MRGPTSSACGPPEGQKEVAVPGRFSTRHSIQTEPTRYQAAYHVTSGKPGRPCTSSRCTEYRCAPPLHTHRGRRCRSGAATRICRHASGTGTEQPRLVSAWRGMLPRPPRRREHTSRRLALQAQTRARGHEEADVNLSRHLNVVTGKMQIRLCRRVVERRRCGRVTLGGESYRPGGCGEGNS